MSNSLKALLLLLCCTFGVQLSAQQAILKGSIQDAINNEPLAGVLIELRGTELYAQTNSTGLFEITGIPAGKYTVAITADGFISQFKAKELSGTVDLGVLTLAPNEEDENITGDDLIPTVMLSEDDFGSGNSSSQDISGVLSAGRDVFQSKAAFSFSVGRFRIRGYDALNTESYFNGIPVNDLENGRPMWWAWSGMNDVTRSRTSHIGMQAVDFAYGGIGGVSTIDASASAQRKGTRLSYLFSNRSYNHRIMATHNTGIMENGWSFSGLASWRYSANGMYVKGAHYNALSYFLSAEKQLGKKHSLSFTALGAPSVRGKGAPAVQEMYDLTGSNYYNSNWGYQTSAETGKRQVRNAKSSDSHQPLFILNHKGKLSDKVKIMNAVSYQFGKYGTTALNWYDAQDPRPDYYRKLPSYYNTENPELANDITDYISANPEMLQLDWDGMYAINRNATDVVANANGVAGNTLTGSRARYLVEERRYDSKRFNVNSVVNANLSDMFTVNGGVTYEWFKSTNFKLIDDLLGADFYLDIDRFAERDSAQTNPDFAQNDLANPNRTVTVGDTFDYNYNTTIHKGSAWGQVGLKTKRIDAFLSGRGGYTSFWRTGNVQNGRFPDNSFGDSEMQNFFTYSARGGLTYKINGRNYLFANGTYETRAPYVRNAYVAPRYRDQLVEGLGEEVVTAVEGGYVLKAPKMNIRLVGYLTQFENQVSQRSFFLDNAILNEDGSTTGGFVNYTLSGIDKQHMGLEFGGEYRTDFNLQISSAVAVGQNLFTSRPEARIFLDANPNALLSEPKKAYIKNYHLPNTPEVATNIGFRYRGKKFWSLSLDFNYLMSSWADFYPDRRSMDAVSKTQEPVYQEQTVIGEEGLWSAILDQQQLPGHFTANLFFSKSWKVKDYFVYLNVGVNNVLHDRTIRTTGFEQYRFDYTDKNVNKFPSKYYYAYGTNYMVSLTFRM